MEIHLTVKTNRDWLREYTSFSYGLDS